MFIDIVFTCLICLLAIPLVVITAIYAIRAFNMRMKGYFVTLCSLVILLIYIIVEIIIEGGIHL